MRHLTLALAATAALAVPAAAAAQDADPAGAYVSLGYAQVDLSGADLGALEARLGYRFNRWFGAEGELGFGVDGDTRSSAVATIKQDLEHKAALYAVAFLPVGPRTDLFARAGYGTTKVETNATSSGHVSAESWNFGVGAQHMFDGVNGVRVDYTRQEFDSAASGGHADVWSVAYTRRF